MRLLAIVLLMAPIPYEPPPEPGPDGYLGVTVQTDLGSGQVMIAEVVEGTPAYKAGLRGGDTILQIGLHRAKDTNDLIKRIRGYRPGETVVLIVGRGGQRHQFRVKLGRRPAELDVREFVPKPDR